jgi:hypothetical protein
LNQSNIVFAFCAEREQPLKHLNQGPLPKSSLVVDAKPAAHPTNEHVPYKPESNLFLLPESDNRSYSPDRLEYQRYLQVSLDKVDEDIQHINHLAGWATLPVSTLLPFCPSLTQSLFHLKNTSR